MSSVTVLIAHPDDELLFLWPFLIAKNAPRAQRIVSVVSDRDNPVRNMPHRLEALKRVAAVLGVEAVCLEFNSDFYKLNSRSGELLHAMNVIHRHCTGTIATHNPWGEYGHLDHILLHTVARSSGARVLCTDLCDQGAGRWLDMLCGWEPGTPLHHATMDRELFNRCRDIYQELGCWTWSWEPQENCGVYACS